MTDLRAKVRRAGRWLRANGGWLLIPALMTALVVLSIVVSGSPRGDFTAILRQGAEALAIGLPSLLGLLVAYQYTAAALDRIRLKPLGQRISVGRHKLHIVIRGEGRPGRPTVVLDAGLRGTVLDWWVVQAQLAEVTCVCAYDRAGYGWSEGGPPPRTASRLGNDLYILLHNAGLPGPYLLVGVETGALGLRLLAAEHPDAVAGMVLLDPVHEAQADVPGFEELVYRHKRALNFREIMARLGLLRLSGGLNRQTWRAAARLPRQAWQAQRTFAAAPRTYLTAYRELSALEQDFEQIHAVRRAVDFPLTVLQSGRGMGNDEALANLSPQGDVQPIPDDDPTTPLPLQQPEAIVAAILAVMARRR